MTNFNNLGEPRKIVIMGLLSQTQIVFILDLIGSSFETLETQISKPLANEDTKFCIAYSTLGLGETSRLNDIVPRCLSQARLLRIVQDSNSQPLRYPDTTGGNCLVINI